jgi:predicted transcriptional regulator
MSDSIKRRLVFYPRPYTLNKVKEIAEKQGTSISKIINEAVKEYIEKPATK